MASAAKHSPLAPPSNSFRVPPPEVPSSNHQELINHTNLFAKRLYSVERVHCFVGWNIANITIVETDNKTLVVVDTGQDLKQMKEVWEEFQNTSTIIPEVKNYPVEAIFLTHHHVDHVNGTLFIKEKFPNAVIIGADNLDSEYQQENGLISPIMSCRAMAQYNNLLAQHFPEEVVGLNSGIGPIIDQNLSGYIQPRQLIKTQTPYEIQRFTIGNTEFQFVYVPSEANSEIAAYLPTRKVLLSAEVIQDHAFPNLYSLRGAKFRDPQNWSKSIDCFLENFSEAQHMILQHGPPIIHNAPNTNPDEPTTFPIVDVLTKYRDAIQYVRDQTLRWAMKGYAKDEIMHLVCLPWEQQEFKPWLQPFYGTVKHAVPAVYTGYIGWFDGDPIQLNPVPRSIMAARIVQDMGGEQTVLNRAKEAYDKGNELAQSQLGLQGAQREWQYAAELATYIIRMRPYLNETQNTSKNDTPASEQQSRHVHSHGPPKHLLHADPKAETDPTWRNARLLKAACFRQMAYREICANWYGTYLTAAHELEDHDMLSDLYGQMKTSSTLLAPTRDVLASLDELAIRLISEITLTLTLTDVKMIYLQVAEPSNSRIACYNLQIRNSVLVYSKVPEIPSGSITVIGSNGDINILLAGEGDGGFDAIIDSGKVTIIPEGQDTVKRVKAFFSYFDAGRFGTPPNIYIH